MDPTGPERQQRFRRTQAAAGRIEWRVWVTEREKAALTDALAAMRAGRSEPVKVQPTPVMVTFTGKPAQAVRDQLRRAGLKWDGTAWVGDAEGVQHALAFAEIAIPAGGRVDLA